MKDLMNMNVMDWHELEDTVTCSLVAEMFDIKVEDGMCKCPFHDDSGHHMKLLDKYFYCDECGVMGNALTFLQKMFGPENLNASFIDGEVEFNYMDFNPNEIKKTYREKMPPDPFRTARAEALLTYLSYRDLLLAMKNKYDSEHKGKISPLFWEYHANYRYVYNVIFMLTSGSREEVEKLLKDIAEEKVAVERRIEDYKTGAPCKIGCLNGYAAGRDPKREPDITA